VHDGGETTGLEWIEPTRALTEVADPPRDLRLPTRLNLQRVAECADSADVIARAAARPAFVTQVTRVKGADGKPRLTIPPDAGYGGTEFDD
jgi:hypothetical protein